MKKYLFTKCLQIVYAFLITDIKRFDKIKEKNDFFGVDALPRLPF